MPILFSPTIGAAIAVIVQRVPAEHIANDLAISLVLDQQNALLPRR
jgi:hypothetical protein